MKLNNFDRAIIIGLLNALIFYILSSIVWFLFHFGVHGIPFALGFGLGSFTWEIIFYKIKGEKLFETIL